jgi:SAM-dependent methyltransferase
MSPALKRNATVQAQPDSSHPDFWEERYRTERLPWDLGAEPIELTNALRSEFQPAGQVLIPGCGSGYEVRSFVAAGWDVCAIDFAPAAVARAQRILGPLADRVRQADFFTSDVSGPYDLIYERTFLCSLPYERWPQYAARMKSLLRPGGRLAGVFYYGTNPEPPPYPLTPAAAQRLLGRHFRLHSDRPVGASQALPLYGGGERWQIWESLPDPTP